jgi:hypothetical protein
MSKEDRLFRAAVGDARLRWEGTPRVGETLLAELGCMVVPMGFFAIGGLVLLARASLLDATERMRQVHASSPPGALVITVGGIILSMFFLPGLVLEWLNLLHTVYYVTDEGVVIVDGSLLRRARRFKVPASLDLAASQGRAGSIEFGDIEYEEIDARGRVVRRESLPLRFRGLGAEASKAIEALRASRERALPPETPAA